MKMLEDLEEVVRLRLRANQERAALDFIRTHQATIRDMAARLEAAEMDAAMLDFLGEKCAGASDSERYLPFRIYWGGGTHRDIREAITKAMQETGR